LPRLEQWAGARLDQDFAWGKTDCHHLALEALAILYDPSPLTHAPTWDSLRQAVNLYAAGWEPNAVLAQAGAEEIPVTFAGPGDIVVEPPKDGFAPVSVALEHGRFLTSQPGARVGFQFREDLAPGARVWRVRG
jgi:hypothetical protein